MKSQILKSQSATTTHVLILVLACLLGIVTSAALAGKHAAPPAKEPAAPALKDTADWHKNEECRKVFFSVLEGLYRDGISEEVVDLVIGRVESNDLERAFIFRCKLCHACYEAFAVYQRRPVFHGTEGISTIGKREIPREVIEVLRNGNRIQFDTAFATVVQPWIRGMLNELIASGADEEELMAKYVELAKEGNSLIVGYARCQACDAIAAVAEKMDETN